MTKEFYEIENIDEIINFLETKGANHNFYYHYTTLDSVNKILQEKSFLLTKGNASKINDHHESNSKGSPEIWNRTYIGSFAFGKSENMAMWALYGIPWEEAVRIEIPKKEMLDWLKSIKIAEEYNLVTKQAGQSIPVFKATLSDIVYSDGKARSDKIILNWSDKHLNIQNKPGLRNIDTNPKITGYIKNYAWHYENEVRLKIVVPKEINYDNIRVKIPDDVVKSFKIMTGPNFRQDLSELEYKDKIKYKSIFTNLVNYRTVCSYCKHENFIRKENT